VACRAAVRLAALDGVVGCAPPMSDTEQVGDVLYELRDGIARLTLNRPDKRNPLGPSMIGALLASVERARVDPAVRVVLLTGAGRVFSAGGDLAAMGQPGAAGGHGIAGTLPDLFVAMTRLGKPIVAMVNGHALAGGCGLVAACDLAIAADDAQFGTPEIDVGLWPMMIMAVIFRSVGRKKGLELMMTGHRISAVDAERIGLVNRAVPRERLDEEAAALCAKIAAKSPRILELGLAGFHALCDEALAEDLQQLQQRFLAVLQTEDAREGLAAFLEKRAPRWQGR
jgi:enoyl-CoA hydratase